MHQPKEHGLVVHAHEHPHEHETPRGGEGASEHPAHPHVHANKRAVANRLARAIGHLSKVKRMVEEDCDCSEVLIQLAAVRAALDNAGKEILKEHIQHCIVDAAEEGDDTAILDLCDAIDKFI